MKKEITIFYCTIPKNDHLLHSRLLWYEKRLFISTSMPRCKIVAYTVNGISYVRCGYAAHPLYYNNLYFVLETWDITVHLITYIVIQLHKNNNS